MWDKIVKMCFELTKRNWGAPWHMGLTMPMSLVLFITSMFIFNDGVLSIVIGFLVTFISFTIYEIYQLKKATTVVKDSEEDCVMNLIGLGVALIIEIGFLVFLVKLS